MTEQGPDEKRTIRQTNAMIRAILEQETLNYPFWVGGIVTKHFLSDRGHEYFDLYDEGSSVNCFLRESVRGTLGFTLNNGMEVEVFGAVRVYEQYARVQIEIENARLIKRPPFVVDATVKEQMERKGLLPKTKKPLPATISRIGLVTSKHSDARNDFFDTYHRENGKGTIQLLDVRIQGQQAPREIADAINRLNRDDEVDVIAIVRGGGRASELAVFNDPLIAEAICRSTIPIVTGIGHQPDETFADQVADISTITPTAAATLLAKQGAAAQSAVQGQARAQPQRGYVILAIAAIAILVIVLLIAVQLINTAR